INNIDMKEITYDNYLTFIDIQPHDRFYQRKINWDFVHQYKILKSFVCSFTSYINGDNLENLYKRKTDY
ncbi:MAG: hypothetical protein AAGA77_14530, partial [Bacteroidota bacterium]